MNKCVTEKEPLFIFDRWNSQVACECVLRKWLFFPFYYIKLLQVFYTVDLSFFLISNISKFGKVLHSVNRLK